MMQHSRSKVVLSVAIKDSSAESMVSFLASKDGGGHYHKAAALCRDVHLSVCRRKTVSARMVLRHTGEVS